MVMLCAPLAMHFLSLFAFYINIFHLFQCLLIAGLTIFYGWIEGHLRRFRHSDCIGMPNSNWPFLWQFGQRPYS